MTYDTAMERWAMARLEAEGISTTQIYSVSWTATDHFDDTDPGQISAYIEYESDDPIGGEFELDAIPLLTFIRQLSEIGFR